ncbi:MAG: hypothetical protein NTW33_01165 [Methanoregula sp.]|nr:hypothetical protein [Methanoregula sp.]
MPKKKLTIDALMDLAGDDQIRRCLLHLASSSPAIRMQVEDCLKKQVQIYDREAIAESVYAGLSCLDVEELWAQSGRTRDGYVDVTEKAYEMFIQSVDDEVEQMKKLLELSQYPDAQEYCMGIILGIDRYIKSESEFLDWSGDTPLEYMEEVVDEYRKGDQNPRRRKEVENLYQALINQ